MGNGMMALFALTDCLQVGVRTGAFFFGRLCILFRTLYPSGLRGSSIVSGVQALQLESRRSLVAILVF